VGKDTEKCDISFILSFLFVMMKEGFFFALGIVFLIVVSSFHSP